MTIVKEASSKPILPPFPGSTRLVLVVHLKSSIPLQRDTIHAPSETTQINNDTQWPCDPRPIGPLGHTIRINLPPGKNQKQNERKKKKLLRVTWQKTVHTPLLPIGPRKPERVKSMTLCVRAARELVHVSHTLFFWTSCASPNISSRQICHCDTVHVKWLRLGERDTDRGVSFSGRANLSGVPESQANGWIAYELTSVIAGEFGSVQIHLWINLHVIIDHS